MLFRDSEGIDSWPSGKNNPQEEGLPGFPPLLQGISLFYPIGKHVNEKDGEQPDPNSLIGT